MTHQTEPTNAVLSTKLDRLIEDFTQFRRTLFGEDGRNGLAADVNDIKAKLRWMCPVLALLSLAVLAAGGPKVLAWALRAL